LTVDEIKARVVREIVKRKLEEHREGLMEFLHSAPSYDNPFGTLPESTAAMVAGILEAKEIQLATVVEAEIDNMLFKLLIGGVIGKKEDNQSS